MVETLRRSVIFVMASEERSTGSSSSEPTFNFYVYRDFFFLIREKPAFSLCSYHL